MSKLYNTKKKTLLGSYLKTDFQTLNKPVLKYSNVDCNWLEKEETKASFQRNSDLLKYAYYGDRKRISIALNYENGADINCYDNNKNTPLILAVYSRSEQTVKYLANYNKDEKGRVLEEITPANLDWLNKDGVSALHLAVKLKNSKLAEILLKAGANPNLSGAYKETPIFNAVRENDTKTIELLLNYGANINARNREGATPAIVASQNRLRQEALLCLIKNGADLYISDYAKRTTLMHAANNNNGAIMDILLKQVSYEKTFIDSQDVNLVSALMICNKRGNREAVRVLLSREANPFLTDKNRKDATDYAKKYNNHTCFEITQKAIKIYMLANEANFSNLENQNKYIQNRLKNFDKQNLSANDIVKKQLQEIGKQNRIENSCVK